MLVESIAMCQSLGSFFEGAMADEQIRNKVNEEQLPSGKIKIKRLLYINCYRQQHCSNTY